MPVYQLPQARELGEGKHWADLTPFSRRNHLAVALIRPKAAAEGFLFLTTVAGVVKRVRLDDLPELSSESFTVINVPEDDALGWAALTRGDDEVLLATASGQLIRFKETDVRPMGLPAGWRFRALSWPTTQMDLVAMDVVGSEYMGLVHHRQRIGQGHVDGPVSRAGPPRPGCDQPAPAGRRLRKLLALLLGEENTQIIITTAIGVTKKLRLKETYAGSRSIKPRSALNVGVRNRVIGAVRFTERPDMIVR